MLEPNHFGLMMVDQGEAEGFISGYATKYKDVLSPAIKIVGKREGVKSIAGMYIVVTKKGTYFYFFVFGFGCFTFFHS